jgi:TonB-linked SusC/RagA family outer membrane protein
MLQATVVAMMTWLAPQDHQPPPPAGVLALAKGSGAPILPWAPRPPTRAVTLQQPTVQGIVVDNRSSPLQGARVAVVGGSAQTLTDQLGRFRLQVPRGEQVTLRASMIGYRPTERTVRVGPAEVRLVLEEMAVNLDEVVVTGTPQQAAKRALGNALGKVRVSQVEEVAPTPNVQDLLSKGVPGVRVMSAGGDVGSGGNIRIRGAGSMALSSEPLLYVDGVRVNNTGADAGGVGGSIGVDSRYAPSRINDLNPEDIESIEVIKGPAAATLYGTEASNGVVNVITRKGREGAPVVNLSVKQGANWLPDPENLFPPTYYRSASGEVKEFRVLRSDRITGEFPGDSISYGPWFRTELQQGYAATISGGTPALGYYFSGDWDRDEGVVPYNWKNRLSGRANLSFTPNEKLGIDFGLGYVRSKYRSAGAIQPVTVRIIWSCPAPGCEPGRNLPNGIDGPFRGYLGGPPETFEEDVEGYEDLDRGTLTATARHRPIGWFSHRLTVGGDFTNQKLSELLRRSTLIGAASPQGSKTVANTRTAYVSADYAATGTFTLAGKLGLESSAGLQYYRKEQDAILSQGTIFPVRALETVTGGSVKTGQENFFENKTFGAYLQQQAAWKNRLFLTAAIRGDDNSAFGQNFDFVVYPKLSASWVLSEEPFFGGVSFVNSLKVRGAWGKAGQQPDVFAAVRTYAPETGDGGLPTLTPENVGNPDLKPEVGQEWETGLDASLFDDRIGLELTLYNKKTTNAIAQVPAPPSAGFPGSEYRNIGEVRNRGIELGLEATVYRAANVGVDLTFKFSRNTNEIGSIGQEPFLTQSAGFGQYHVVGFPLAGIFHRRVVSADLVQVGGQNTATNMMCESGEVVPGTAGVNGVGFSAGGGPAVPCLQAPAVYWGSAIPVWEGAAALSVTLFQNLQLFGQVDFVGGHTILSGDVRAAHMSFRNSRAIQERTDPILLAYDILDTRRQPGIMKGGFAKLRDLSLTYNIPRRLTQRFGANRASFTVSARNFWTIWVAQKADFGHELIDPEIRNNDLTGQTAYNQEGWPQSRRLLATLRVTF